MICKWELILFCARENHSALKIKIHYTVIHGSDLLKKNFHRRVGVVFNLVRRKKIVKGGESSVSALVCDKSGISVLKSFSV